MTLTHEQDYRPRVREIGPTRFLPGTAIEIVREIEPGREFRYALFDFDGTLSLIREGWTDVMVAMMVETLLATGTDEPPKSLEALVRGFVAELTGKQTIYQMIRLAEEVKRRGGTPEDPLEYKRQYHELLMRRIRDRREALRRGEMPADEMLVPGARAALEALRERGVELYLASGTDEAYVLEEARLLQLDELFAGRIYGAQDDYRRFSKALVIQRILEENRVTGSQLLGFGDGYVEIDNVKAVDGTAIAVASDESGRSGKPDPWKRERLIGIGADVVIPDYREWPALFAYLWGET